MYSHDDRIRAVRVYIQYDKSAAAVIRELGNPERKPLRYWYEEYLRDNRLKKKFVRSPKYNGAQKEAAVMELCTKDENVQEIASRYQVSRCSIYQWARELLGEGSVSSVPKRNKAEEPKPATIEELQSQVNDLTKQARELKDEVFRLRVERDVLEKVAEVATVSECTRSNTKKLTKTSITDELIKEVCSLYGDRYDDRDEDT